MVSIRLLQFGSSGFCPFLKVTLQVLLCLPFEGVSLLFSIINAEKHL